LRLPQASVRLGRVEARRGAQAVVEIENIGGTTADVIAEIGAPFSLPEPAFAVRPGEQKRIRLDVMPGPPQRYRTWMKFKGGATTPELEVEAELVSGAAIASRITHPEEAEKTKPEPPPADPEPWMPDLNFARSIRVTNVTPTSADIEWPVEMNGARSFRLERLMFTRDSAREIRNVWLPLPKTSLTRRDPQWIATLAALHPNQSQTIRVVPLGPEGQPGNSLFRLDFYTPPAASFPKPGLFPSLLVAFLAIGAFVLFRKLRRHYTEPISGF
jgi:hypothetical protein